MLDRQSQKAEGQKDAQVKHLVVSPRVPDITSGSMSLYMLSILLTCLCTVQQLCAPINRVVLRSCRQQCFTVCESLLDFKPPCCSCPSPCLLQRTSKPFSRRHLSLLGVKAARTSCRGLLQRSSSTTRATGCRCYLLAQ